MPGGSSSSGGNSSGSSGDSNGESSSGSSGGGGGGSVSAPKTRTYLLCPTNPERELMTYLLPRLDHLNPSKMLYWIFANSW
jgi:hypothetical protein